MPMNLHLGVRYEETDITSAALSIKYDGSRWSKAGNELYITEAVENGQTAQTFEDFYGNYDFVLPSLDVDFELSDDLILRASYSETITRPSYEDIKGGLTASSTQYYPGVNANASAGNPGLEPIHAENLSLIHI